MYKLILGLFGPTLSFIYEKINSNSIFKVISFSFIRFCHLLSNLPDRKNDGGFDSMNSSRLFCICSTDLNWDSLGVVGIEIGNNQKKPSLESTPHEKEFPSLSLRWFPESFLFCGVGRYLAAVLLAFSLCLCRR